MYSDEGTEHDSAESYTTNHTGNPVTITPVTCTCINRCQTRAEIHCVPLRLSAIYSMCTICMVLVCSGCLIGLAMTASVVVSCCAAYLNYLTFLLSLYAMFACLDGTSFTSSLLLSSDVTSCRCPSTLCKIVRRPNCIIERVQHHERSRC